MSIKLAGSVMERRNSTTAEIDRLSTRDMLNVINQEDKRIADAITPCLDNITQLIDTDSCINKSGHFLITLNQRKPYNSLT